MNVKLFELRDRATFIPIFAFRCRADFKDPETAGDAQHYLLRRCGFDGIDGVIVGRLECAGLSRNCAGLSRNCTYDPFAWNDRTFQVAHLYILQHFDELKDGDVIDVEFILGEKAFVKISERCHDD